MNSDKAHPLLIFYDCETTGLDIYSEHITDIGAKVVNSPVPLETPTFSSLVATSREIPPRGMFVHTVFPSCMYEYLLFHFVVTKITGITAAMLDGEKPISEVFPLFLDWVTTTTTYVSNVTKTPHYPGKTNTYSATITTHTYFHYLHFQRSSSSPQWLHF